MCTTVVTHPCDIPPLAQTCLVMLCIYTSYSIHDVLFVVWLAFDRLISLHVFIPQWLVQFGKVPIMTANTQHSCATVNQVALKSDCTHKGCQSLLKLVQLSDFLLKIYMHFHRAQHREHLFIPLQATDPEGTITMVTVNGRSFTQQLKTKDTAVQETNPATPGQIVFGTLTIPVNR